MRCDLLNDLLKSLADWVFFTRIQGDVQTAEGCKSIVESIAAKESHVSSFSIRPTELTSHTDGRRWADRSIRS